MTKKSNWDGLDCNDATRSWGGNCPPGLRRDQSVRCGCVGVWCVGVALVGGGLSPIFAWWSLCELGQTGRWASCDGAAWLETYQQFQSLSDPVSRYSRNASGTLYVSFVSKRCVIIVLHRSSGPCRKQQDKSKKHIEKKSVVDGPVY